MRVNLIYVHAGLIGICCWSGKEFWKSEDISGLIGVKNIKVDKVKNLKNVNIKIKKKIYIFIKFLQTKFRTIEFYNKILKFRKVKILKFGKDINMKILFILKLYKKYINFKIL